MILQTNRTKQSVKFYQKAVSFCRKFLIVILFSAFLINHACNKSSKVENLLIDASGMFHSSIDKSYKVCSNFWYDIHQYFFNIKFLKSENQMLAKKVLELNNELNQLIVLKNQNIELRRLLNFVAEKKAHSVSAKLISIVNSPEGEYALINCGKKHLVEVGDTVVCQEGFVGKVMHVGNFYSKILLVTNSKLRIPVRTASGQKGILKGDPKRPYVSYLARPNEIQENELLMTCLDISSSIADIPVAKIYANDNRVFARTNIKFNDIRFVTVLKRP